MIFYLGTHEVHWLGLTDIPLFISRRRLARRRNMPRASGVWALDSGGFSELSMYGEWRTSPEQYANEVRRFRDEIGNLKWAVIQDWMCEPFMIKKTGKSIREHQQLTTINYLELMAIDSNLPWLPVIQGYSFDDYFEHVEIYDQHGIDLREFDVVGIGSMCRREGTLEAARIIGSLAAMGLKLHAFGFKIRGLRRTAHYLASADSMAWSFEARKKPPMDGCTHKHCNNCIKYALQWYAIVVDEVNDSLKKCAPIYLPI